METERMYARITWDRTRINFIKFKQWSKC